MEKFAAFICYVAIILLWVIVVQDLTRKRCDKCCRRNERKMTKLKKCPFCGGEAKLKKGYPSQQKTGQRMAFVQCTKCMAKTGTFYQMAYESWDDVIRYAMDAWQGRAGDGNGTD